MSCRIVVVLLAVCFCPAGPGCTYRAWYEGFRERQRQECNEERGRDEIQKCLDRVNSLTYDEYVKSRGDSQRKAK